MMIEDLPILKQRISHIPTLTKIKERYRLHLPDTAIACGLETDVLKNAMSYYPDIDFRHVRFALSEISTTLQARPQIGSLLSGNDRKKWQYTILINKSTDFGGVNFFDIPESGQVGILCHEFAHFIDYRYKSFPELLSTGVDYLFPKSKRSYERSIDYLTIIRGAGLPLLKWAEVSMSKLYGASETYIRFKRKTYLSPEEVMFLVSLMNDD
jgi:hypothetical protein